MPDSISNEGEQVDAVVLDEDAVGAPDGNGEGAKILRGKGALDFYLRNLKTPSEVKCTADFDTRCTSMILDLKIYNQHNVYNVDFVTR